MFGDRQQERDGSNNSGLPKTEEVFSKKSFFVSHYPCCSSCKVFVKPHSHELSEMTYGQTNEMMWAVHHHVPLKEVLKKHKTASLQRAAQKRIQKEMREKIHKNFWYLYGKATRGVDKRAQVTPLSWFSPAALQKIWEENVGPKSLKLSKQVHILDKYRKKLPTVREANKKDQRIPSSSAPATQSPPAS